jgi:hypothetical protein
MEQKNREEIQRFLHEDLKVDQAPSLDEFKSALLSAYMDRSTQIFFIWKKIKELYPDVDANRIIREGSWDFGVWQGNKVAKKFGGPDNVGPKEALMGQSSRGGVMVFEQEIMELNDEKALKVFHVCPHAKALEALGQDKATIKMFCRDMMGACDYGICAPFKHVKIDFPTTVADGEGKGCAMTITRVNDPD